MSMSSDPALPREWCASSQRCGRLPQIPCANPAQVRPNFHALTSREYSRSNFARALLTRRIYARTNFFAALFCAHMRREFVSRTIFSSWTSEMRLRFLGLIPPHIPTQGAGAFIYRLSLALMTVRRSTSALLAEIAVPNRTTPARRVVPAMAITVAVVLFIFIIRRSCFVSHRRKRLLQMPAT